MADENNGVKKKYECLELNTVCSPLWYISKSVLHFKPFCYVEGINKLVKNISCILIIVMLSTA